MDNIVFLGDSITQGFKLLLSHNKVSNMGISGNRTIDVIKRLDSVINKNPDKLFLMIGINDYMTNNDIWFTDKPIDIKKTYEYILNELTAKLPNTKFYIMPILPITDGEVVKKFHVNKFNIEIDELNEMIKDLVEKYQLMYLEINVDFKNNQNELKRDYTYDGIHLSELGYEIFYKKIIKFIE
ncbi:MAG: Lipolytic protein family [Haloplasmataceae bacterium]|nr:Lipolytic protein family [Haloplasmataceae bacterium]